MQRSYHVCPGKHRRRDRRKSAGLKHPGSFEIPGSCRTKCPKLNDPEEGRIGGRGVGEG